MKVAHLAIGTDIAGGERVALQLMDGARNAGWETLLITPAEGRLTAVARDAGHETRAVRLGRAGDPRNATRVRTLLRTEGVGLLHTHALLAGNLAGRLGARLAGVPVISHMHASDRFGRDGAAAWGRRRADTATTRLCAAVIAVSNELKESLERLGYPPDRIVVIENGVDLTPSLADRATTREQLGVAGEAPVALMVGRLSPDKGQLDLIEAIAEVPDLRGVIVGVDVLGSGYAEKLGAAARELGVEERVLFAGFRSDVSDLLAAADVLVLPSRQEELPLVVLEAMAQGVPVVASRVGALPGLVEARGAGILVEPGDIGLLADAIRRVVGDRTAAAAMGEAGRTTAAGYDVRKMVAEVLALYDDVLAR